MPENKFDYEKDHLVITRERDGAFRGFNWYSAEKFTLAEIEAKIAETNEKHKQTESTGLFFELVTDELAREICAYKQRARPLEDLIQDAKEVQASIDQAVEYLEDALSDLNRIRGLD